MTEHIPVTPDSGPQLPAGLLEGLTDGDPLMLELLMAAALPRTFDLDILAGLLDRDRDDPELGQAWNRLTSHALVEERANGQFGLHDLIRSYVSARWLQPERLGQRGRLLERLRSYYDDRYLAARDTAGALGEVGVLMRRVRPQRYQACLELIEDQLVRPAIDAVLAAAMISAGDGWQQFTESYAEQESQRRYRVCELLITGYAGAATLLPEPNRPAHQGWVSYFQARLANSREQWQQALQLLEGIDAGLLTNHQFAGWVKQAIAVALRGQCRFAEAIAVLDELVELNEKYHEDDYNAVVAFSAKAQLHQQLWDAPAEIQASYAAIANAAQYDNEGAELLARLGLAYALSASGEPDSAVVELMAAMRLSRLELGTDAATSRLFAAQALGLLGVRSRRLFATLAEQYRQLSLFSWPNGEFEVLMAEAPTLRDGGDAAAAASTYQLAIALADEHLPDRRWEVESDWAGAAADLGEPIAGAEANLAILANPAWPDDRWTTARCLSNAGDSYLRAHQLDQALDCLGQAEAKWVEMRHRQALTWTRSLQAEASRQRGDIAGAQRRFDDISIEPARGYEAQSLHYRALARRDGQRFDEAAEDSRQAAISFEKQGQRVTAIRSWLVAVECLIDARRDVEASAAGDELRRLVAGLDGYTSWRPDPKQVLADEHAGRALRILIDGRGSMASRRRAAREHLDYAIELDPANSWFLVERAFVELAESNRAEAAETLALALARAEDPVLADGIRALADSVVSGQQPDARTNGT